MICCLHRQVKKFKEAILASDAILFATPEYNYSIPGMFWAFYC
jgi:NAD(P)H-dependent FMN reductase